MAEVQKRKENLVPVRFIGVFVILAAAMMAAGYIHYRGYEKHYRTGVERELSAIAHLKASELAKWRGERLGDGEIARKNTELSDQVARYLRNPRDREAERRVRDWLRRYPEYYEYDQVRLLDPQGVTRMSIPPGRSPASAAVRERIPEVLQTGRTTMIDFYRHDYDQRIYLSVITPILDASAGNRAIALLALRADPAKYVYPFIKRWLTPSLTAETQLVRREGNDVLFLNDQKFEIDSALRLRVPLEKTEAPAVKAVLGQTGIVEGLDDRGVQVIADVRNVPDSPWFLVTRMDRSEVLGPVREHMWMLIGLVGAMVFGTGAGLALIWRQQSLFLYRDRYEAAEALRESEARLSKTQEVAHLGSWELDLVNNRLYWSDEAYRIFGLQPQEFGASYEAFLDAIHPDDRAAVDAAYTGSLREGKDTYEIEHRVVRKATGEIRSVHEKCFHDRDESGRIIRSTGMVHDITERKRAEEALRASEQNLALHVMQTPLGVIEWDMNFKVTKWNPAAERIFGYRESEARGAHASFIVPPSAKDHVDQIWSDLIRHKGGLRSTNENMTKDGRSICCEWYNTPLVDAGGRVIAVASLIQEITERRRAEEEFKKVSRQNELILESAGEGIYGLDLQGNVTFINTVAAQMAGFSREEVLGRSGHLTWHYKKPDGSPYPVEECRIYAAYTEGNIYSGESAFWRKDGTAFPVDFTSRPIYEEGKISGAVVTYRDITERKRAEEELHHKQDMLTHAEVIAHVGSWELDLINNRLHWSDEAYRIFGFEPQALNATYETFLEVVHPDDRAAVDAAYTGSVREGRDTYEIEHSIVRKSTGEVRIVHEKCFHVRDESGRVIRSTGMTHDITERKRLEETITQMAQHDPLTGLPNRRLFREIVDRELAQARRNRYKVALLFVDLDRFKDVNDTFGHEAGDELLKEVSKRLKASIRESDAAARIGGDEFTVILADIFRTQDITHISTKIMESFVKPAMIAGHEIQITASIGISIYPDDGDKIDTLCRYADIAMYHAKERGRNAFQFYNPEINKRSIERRQMESMLQQSIELGELAVYYQPQVDISSRQIVSAEALVRWNHPERGLLEPKQFISTAEDAGFITAIDEYVLKTACAQVRAWLDAGLPAVRITVNLSAREFQNPELIGTITHILENTCTPPGYLDIEITESLAMSNIDRTIARLSELAKMGVDAYIDDFGAGYSSLNSLKRLPIRKLKIDRSFIKEIATSPDDRAIIVAVTGMAHTMRMGVLAEGVETEEQLSFLRSTQCDEAQGYLFSKALPAEEFGALLAGSR